MIVHSTGQTGSPLLNLDIIRVDIMNKTPDTQIVSILIWDTGTSPKTNIFDATFSISPQSGDFRQLNPLLFPDTYEVVVRTNHPNIVPYITGIDILGSLNPNVTFKYGDLFIAEYPGTVQL
jgi:hypothetical protein